MADLATAYVKIVPSLKGAKSTIQRELDGVDSKSSGMKMGEGIKSGFGKIAIGNFVADILTRATTAAADVAVDTFKQAFNNYANYEQLSSGAQKIFDEIDFQRISQDAQSAYKELNLSANQYLETINLVGATFSQTMGDEKGYETARRGMLAVSDYATGTGKNVELLNEKYQMITRSAGSYQSIADQFAGILPQTSADFLAQAQAAGLLSDEYTSLTDVPVAEYQQAVTEMLVQGVDDLGLAQNTLHESTETLSGSIAMTQAAWQNFLTGLGDSSADMVQLVDNLVESIGTTAGLIIPKIAEIMSRLAEALPQLVDRLLPVLTEHSTELIESLSEVIAALLPVLLEAAAMLFMAIVIALAKATPQVLANMGRLVLNLISAIVNGIAPAMEAMNGFVQGILDTIGNFLGALWNAGVELVNSIISGAAQTGSDMARYFGEWINAAFQAVVNFFGGFASAGAGLVNSLVGGISQVAGNIVSFIADWMNAAYQTAANFAGWFYNAGAEIINGLIQGIANNIGAVVDTITGGVMNAVNSVKAALGIASPSKLFAGIGEFTMEGFAKGVEDATGEARRSMQAAMDDVYGTADGVASVSMRAEASGAGSVASEVASLRDALRQVRLVLDIDGRAFAEATVGEMDRALGTMSRRAVAR